MNFWKHSPSLRQELPPAKASRFAKLLLSFRKEWLAEVEKCVESAGVDTGKYFLERLDREGIKEAVSGLTRSNRLVQKYNLHIEGGLPEMIADEYAYKTRAPLLRPPCRSC
jgi:hypothetical protein